MKVYSSPNGAAGSTQGEVLCLIPAPKLAARVHELGEQMSADHADKSILVLGVLHGAFVFMADLVRHFTIPVRCGFVMVSSYGDRTTTSGGVRLKLDATLPIEGNHVLLVDDIVDTGISTAWLMDHLARKKPASLRLCALLDKPARRRIPVHIDYVGFEIPDRFVVGYGIDCAGLHRELPYVGYISGDEQPSGA